MTYFDPGSDARAFSTRRRQEGAPITEAPLGEPHLPVAPPPRLLKQGRTVWPWVWFVVAFFAEDFFFVGGAAVTSFWRGVRSPNASTAVVAPANNAVIPPLNWD